MSMHLTKAPHQGARDPLNVAPNAALLIDFDNVTMGMRSDLSKELKTLLNSDIIKGKVTVQRAYADWRRYPQYIVPLSEASIDLIFAPAYGSNKKNATDIRMAIDGIELVFIRPEIGTFILLTGDSDFSSLVLKLKEYGKYVIGVGIQESSSDILVQNCDEYYSYTSLSGLRKTSDSDPRRAIDPWVLVERAIDQMTSNDDVMRSDRLKQVMVELDPGFDEGEYGFSKFSRFLTEASGKGLVTIRKLDNGQYEVGASGRKAGRAAESTADEPRAPSRERGERGGRGRGRGRGRDDESRPRESEAPRASAPPREREAVEAMPAASVPAGPVEAPLQAAYDLLRRALERLAADGRAAVRDSDVKRKMLELDAAFDETNLGFSKFNRFLRQAHDHEIVNLDKHESGNFEVSLPAGRPGGRAPAREAAPTQSATSAPSAPPAPSVPMSSPSPSIGEQPKESALVALGRRFGLLFGAPPAPPAPSTPRAAPSRPPEAAPSSYAPPSTPVESAPPAAPSRAETVPVDDDDIYRDDREDVNVSESAESRPPRSRSGRPRREGGESAGDRPRRSRSDRGPRERAPDVGRADGDAAQTGGEASQEGQPRPRRSGERSRGGRGRGRGGRGASENGDRDVVAADSAGSPSEPAGYSEPESPRVTSGSGQSQADGTPEPVPVQERSAPQSEAFQPWTPAPRAEEPVAPWTPPAETRTPPVPEPRAEEPRREVVAAPEPQSEARSSAAAEAPTSGLGELDDLEPSRLHGRTRRGRRR